MGSVIPVLKFWAVALLMLLLCSCPASPTYEAGTFSQTVTPLTGANSQYDDYNSLPPADLVNLDFPLYFSTNRSTSGGTFDIEAFQVNVHWDQRDGSLSLDAEKRSGDPTWQNANSPSNEFGPSHAYVNWQDQTYLFASDRNGNLDIFHFGADGSVRPSVALNSEADDAYPTLGPDHRLYFCSNRSGHFQIYSVAIPSDQSLITFLDTPGASVLPVATLSSNGDDKAPYINGNLMVFASNRPGGSGGYDLWWSVYRDGKWSAPVNFGSQINTQYDEFRPVTLVSESNFTNNLMIFSSNRPGGMGGFDLYWVGVPKVAQ